MCFVSAEANTYEVLQEEWLVDDLCESLQPAMLGMRDFFGLLHRELVNWDKFAGT